MSDETVQRLGRIVAAEAEYQDIGTESLSAWVIDGAYCLAKPGTPAFEARAWEEQWVAPPESHEHIPQHRYDERVAMVAAHLCGPCPVRQACLALSEREPHNYRATIRGGMVPVHRRLFPADIEIAGEGR